MEIEQGPIGGSAIFDAVLNQAKSEHSRFKMKMMEVRDAESKAVFAKEEAEQARERWEQCIAFLGKHFPKWESVISEDDLKRARG